jgi:hypothetical protein
MDCDCTCDQRTIVSLLEQVAALATGMHEIRAQQAKIENQLETLIEQRQVQDWYGTNAAAKVLEKSEYTVREWCRYGRVHAEKRTCGRGKAKEWMISHEELMRIKAEGLLPQTRPQ